MYTRSNLQCNTGDCRLKSNAGPIFGLCFSDRLLTEVLAADMGLEMVSEILTVSEAGRAPRQSPGIFALALILTHAKLHANTQPAAEDTDEQKLARSAKASASRRVRSKLFCM